MAKELMEIGGFITSGAEIVNHDNSLSGNGTVDSPLSVVPGYNETVLWENASGANSGVLSENALNFNAVEIYGGTNDGEQWYTRVIPNLFNGRGIVPLYHTTTNGEVWFKGGRIRIDGTTFKIENVREKSNTSITGSWSVIDDNILKIPVIKVVGINRKA